MDTEKKKSSRIEHHRVVYAWDGREFVMMLQRQEQGQGLISQPATWN